MADVTYFESRPGGISHPATGSTSSWGNFYRGIVPAPPKPGTANGGYIERTPSPGPASPYMTAAERAEWDKLYRNPVPTVAPPTQVASAPVPLTRPDALKITPWGVPSPMDVAAMGALPPPSAVAAEMSTVPPIPAAAPPSGGQLAALLEAAQGLGGLLSGVLPGGGGGSSAPARQPSMTPQQQAAAYNSQNKSGFNDWGVSGGGTVYSKSLHDKVTSRAGTGSPSASKTAGGRARDKYGNPL